MAKLNPIELQKALKGVDYPASKEDLVRAVDGNAAGDEIRDAVSQLPEKSFERPTDVTEAMNFGGDGKDS